MKRKIEKGGVDIALCAQIKKEKLNKKLTMLILCCVAVIHITFVIFKNK